MRLGKLEKKEVGNKTFQSIKVTLNQGEKVLCQNCTKEIKAEGFFCPYGLFHHIECDEETHSVNHQHIMTPTGRVVREVYHTHYRCMINTIVEVQDDV